MPIFYRSFAERLLIIDENLLGGAGESMSFSSEVKDELKKKDFTASQKAFNMRFNDSVHEREKIFLRTKFLKSGSVTDPNKDYHLEFIADTREEAEEISSALSVFSLDPRIVKRGKYQIVSLRDAEEISEVLGIFGAVDALMKFENVRILKEVSENVNRRVNFETANISRTVRASLRQVEDIRLIEERLGIDSLEPGLREIARHRLKFPDASLEELAAGMDPPIGKSGANHRMRKIAQIADEIRSGGRESEIQESRSQR